MTHTFPSQLLIAGISFPIHLSLTPDYVDLIEQEVQLWRLVFSTLESELAAGELLANGAAIPISTIDSHTKTTKQNRTQTKAVKSGG